MDEDVTCCKFIFQLSNLDREYGETPDKLHDEIRIEDCSIQYAVPVTIDTDTHPIQFKDESCKTLINIILMEEKS